MALEIKWNKSAVDRLQKELKRIGAESIQNAEIVEKAILERVKVLPNFPEKYPIDYLKQKNDGSYRCFNTHSYRVSYRVLENEIRILRVRHQKQKPKSF